MNKNEKHFLNESPISGKDKEEDKFNFLPYAEKVKEIIQKNSNNKEPITIGIYGKWGDGKTSFSNLIKYKIEHFDNLNKKEYLIYEFNPWRYSTEDELLFDFFDGLKKRFYVKDKTKLQIVGDSILKYSKYLKAIKLSSTVGIPRVKSYRTEFMLDKFFEALGEDLKGEEITIEFLKNKVNEAINKVNFKILVIIDDIDRLDDNEITTILKLVKINANFENFIFILNFDEEQVAKALNKKSGSAIEDGRNFLEKIINIPIQLPKIENNLLDKYFHNQLAIVLNNLDFKYEEQQDINSRINFLNYEFKNPRQIIRVLNSFFIGAFALKNEVNIFDLFTIEYIKIIDSKLYNEIKSILTDTSKSLFDGFFNETFYNKLKSIETDKKELFNSLFNKSRKYEDKSISNPNYFDRYFSYHIGNKIPTSKIENILKLLNSDKTEDNELQQVYEELFTYEDVYQVILDFINKFIDQKTTRDKFYKLITKNNNIDLIPNNYIDYYGINNKNRLIETLAINLDDDLNNDNELIAIEIANQLDVYSLCHFTRKFKESKKYKNSLKEIIVTKAKGKFKATNPVYVEPSQPAKMIMLYWKEIESQSFEKHIESTLISLNNIKKFIQNFPFFTFGNLSYGSFVKRDFEFISEKIFKVNILFEKIKEFDKELVDSINTNNFIQKDETEEATEQENLEQFIYWYKLENNL